MNSRDCCAVVALDSRQREQVARHLPLVQHTLNRHPGLWRRRRRREPAELIQEGCLALIDAVRRHDPSRHGKFAAFAMARIRWAMARHAAEQDQSIRVPFTTQRRRDATAQPDARPQPADQPPRVLHLCDRGNSFVAGRSAGTLPEQGEGSPPITLGSLLRERCERAIHRALALMRSSPRCTPDTRRIIDACFVQRWSIPDPEARAPVRQLAADLRCRVSRVTHCEARFRRHLARLLAADAGIDDLRHAARRRPEGWDAEADAQTDPRRGHAAIPRH